MKNKNERRAVVIKKEIPRNKPQNYERKRNHGDEDDFFLQLTAV